jgi:hypothetical protein
MNGREAEKKGRKFCLLKEGKYGNFVEKTDADEKKVAKNSIARGTC